MCWCGAAAAADQIDQAALSEFPQHPGHVFGCLVVLAELVGEPRIGVGAHECGSDSGKLLDVLPQGLRAEGAVQPNAEWASMGDRVPEGLGRLTRQRAAACISDGSRDHHRHPYTSGLEIG